MARHTGRLDRLKRKVVSAYSFILKKVFRTKSPLKSNRNSSNILAEPGSKKDEAQVAPVGNSVKDFSDREDAGGVPDTPWSPDNQEWDEWDEHEYPPLSLDKDVMKLVVESSLPGNHGECTAIHVLERGSFHEIRILEFADGWSCIGRFTRNPLESLDILESEVATLTYVRKNTTIPVPEVYHVNYDAANPVGARFVLMERMKGVNLYTIWDKLSTEQKLAVMDQIADVLAQLSSLKFDKIGSIKLNNDIGPLQTQLMAENKDSNVRGPFTTMEEYLHSYIAEGRGFTPEADSQYALIRRKLHDALADQTDDLVYNPPFRLIHGDFDAQNMLFNWPDEAQPPKLSAVIDWDYSYSGPLYYLYEYPIFIQDNDTNAQTKAAYAENKILRQNFVRMLAQKFPRGSTDREDVQEVFRQKCYHFSRFRYAFMTRIFYSEEEERRLVLSFVDGARGKGDYPDPYGGRIDYESDSELDSDDGNEENEDENSIDKDAQDENMEE